VLTIQASGTESLWDEILPAEVKALPDDLARLDELLSDPGLLAPIGARWDRLLAETGASSGRGRPTIAMESYVRLMIVKHRSGWGNETLMREVSDSLHLPAYEGSERSEGGGGNWGDPPRPDGPVDGCCRSVASYNRCSAGKWSACREGVGGGRSTA
jgi:hypothetical protein